VEIALSTTAVSLSGMDTLGALCRQKWRLSWAIGAIPAAKSHGCRAALSQKKFSAGLWIAPAAVQRLAF